MTAIIPALISVVLGLLGLLWGADRFVAGSAASAKNFGISPLVVGLTFVSIGTSAPEIFVALNASLNGLGIMAVGNALGSNIANLGLVLGTTALIAPLPTQHHLLKQETPVLLGITALSGIFLANDYLSRADGLILLGLLVPLLWATIYYKKKKLSPEEISEEEEITDFSTKIAIFWFIVGLVVLIVSSQALVWGAEQIAITLGISELIIGLTVVAIGTSLPEMAASVMSAVRGHHDIALGNIFGSNMFNLMAVMSIPGIVSPLSLSDVVFRRDFTVMGLFTLLLVISIWLSLRGKGATSSGRLGRRFGALLLALWFGYNYLILTNS